MGEGGGLFEGELMKKGAVCTRETLVKEIIRLYIHRLSGLLNAELQI